MTSTSERLREDAEKIAAALRDGATMNSQKQRYGLVTGGPIRTALAAAGFDSKGQPMKVRPIKATGAALAKRLIKEREAGTPWYLLALATGKPEAELREIVAKAGGSTGRVYRRAGA